MDPLYQLPGGGGGLNSQNDLMFPNNTDSPVGVGGAGRKFDEVGMNLKLQEY